jgi:hypothetical protein
MPFFRVVFLVLLCLVGLGCKEPIEKLTLSPEERERVLQLHTFAADTRERVPADAGEGGRWVAASNCKVFRSLETQGVVYGWERVDLPTQEIPRALLVGACVRESVQRLEDGFVYVSFCGMLIGAGGGCQMTGHYRTRDGTHWEHDIGPPLKDQWEPVSGGPVGGAGDAGTSGDAGAATQDARDAGLDAGTVARDGGTRSRRK